MTASRYLGANVHRMGSDPAHASWIAALASAIAFVCSGLTPGSALALVVSLVAFGGALVRLPKVLPKVEAGHSLPRQRGSQASRGFTIRP
jgi:hypothetical protein